MNNLSYKNLYIDDHDRCLFCGEVHCIEELKLRPLFLLLGVFSAWGNFTQDYIIQNARIEIDFKKKIISYTVITDILLSTFTFDGEATYFFEYGPLLAIGYEKLYNKNIINETKEVLNIIKEGWPFPNLEDHNVIVV